MRQCEYCNAELSDEATFCGQCGRIATDEAEAITGVTEIPTAELNAIPTEYDEEDEEEKRRRAALLGLSLPVLADSVARGPTVPVVQGTPQVSDVPFVQGTSQTPHQIHGFQPGKSPRDVLQSEDIAPQPKHIHHRRRTAPHGFMRAAMVTVVASTLVVAGLIGAGYTVLHPSLSLNGSTNVIAGQPIHLHGSHFIPGSHVALTLDGRVPLYHISREPEIRLSSHGNITTANTTTNVTMLVRYLIQNSTVTNTIVVGANGTFDVTINVSPDLSAGHHTIRATEQISHRSAVLNIIVQQPGQTLIPSPSSSPTAISSPTDTSTPTTTSSPTVTPSPSSSSPTPTTAIAGLSCVTPGSITLTANQGSNQSGTKMVSLCASGSGLLTWTASWDHNQASWLQLDHGSGQIQAPGQGQIKVSAKANGLKPGKYTTTVTFSSQPGNSTESLSVSFTVQAPCVSVTPTTLTFTGVVANADPKPQTVTLHNCGNTNGNWSVSTDSNWLTVNPASGSLDGGTKQQVIIGVSVTGLKIGTYTGNVTFTLGSSHSSVQVTLTMQAPTLSELSSNCGSAPQVPGGWNCTVTLTNKGDVQGNLDWSASSSGAAGITFTPSSGTLPATPGNSVTVTVFVPGSNCSTSATLSFIGPANTVNVSFNGSCPG